MWGVLLFFNHELRVKGLNCVNGWGSFSQVSTPTMQPIVRLSGKWRTTRTKATIAICSAKHKGVKQRQVVLKDYYSPSTAVMTANYERGGAKWGGKGTERCFFKRKSFYYRSSCGSRNLCVCVCWGGYLGMCIFPTRISVLDGCVCLCVLMSLPSPDFTEVSSV